MWQFPTGCLPRYLINYILAVVHTWIVSLYIEPWNIGKVCLCLCTIPVRTVLAIPITYNYSTGRVLATYIFLRYPQVLYFSYTYEHKAVL